MSDFYWDCPYWEEEVVSERVTFQGKHDKCGHDVEVLDRTKVSYEALEIKLAACQRELADEKAKREQTEVDLEKLAQDFSDQDFQGMNIARLHSEALKRAEQAEAELDNEKGKRLAAEMLLREVIMSSVQVNLELQEEQQAREQAEAACAAIKQVFLTGTFEIEHGENCASWQQYEKCDCGRIALQSAIVEPTAGKSFLDRLQTATEALREIEQQGTKQIDAGRIACDVISPAARIAKDALAKMEGKIT